MAGGEHVGQVEATESLVEGEPPVDATRHGDGADVAVERHAGGALGSEAVGVGPAAGAARGVEGGDRPVVHEREQVATHAAHVRGGHGQHGAGGHGGVDRGAAGTQHRHAGRRGQVVDAAHHAVRCVVGRQRRSGRGRRRTRRFTVQAGARMAHGLGAAARDVGRPRRASSVDPRAHRSGPHRGGDRRLDRSVPGARRRRSCVPAHTAGGVGRAGPLPCRRRGGRPAGRQHRPGGGRGAAPR